MKLPRTSASIAFCCAILLLHPKTPAHAQTAASPVTATSVNLLAWGAGALIVQAPPSYEVSGDWSLMMDCSTSCLTRVGPLNPAT